MVFLEFKQDPENVQGCDWKLPGIRIKIFNSKEKRQSIIGDQPQLDSVEIKRQRLKAAPKTMLQELKTTLWKQTER